MPTRPGGAPLNIANGVREFAIATPRELAVADGQLVMTYAGLDERSNRLAQILLGEGLQPGDRVGIVLGNRFQYPEIACGIAKAGMVSVPVNPRLTGPEVSDILGRAQVRGVVLEKDATEVVAPSVEALQPSVVLSLDSLDGADLGQVYEHALADARPKDPRIEVDEQAPFTIAFTGGTTGAPKGVVISHRSRCLTFYAAALEWGLGRGRRTLAVAPMYHGAGFAFAYAAVHTGGTLAVLRSWDPERFLDAVRLQKPHSVFLVPTHLQTLRALGEDALTRGHMASVDTIYVNAAPLPQALKEWTVEQLPQMGLHELYGSTEAGVVSDCRPADILRKPGSVGPPWLMTEVRLVGPDGQEVGVGEPGELYSRSPYVFSGYLDDPAATEACTTADGFVSAGDVAVRDDEHFLTIVDRVKDMIITGGLNVYPREVEEVLLTHPAVADAAVVGLPDERRGERVVAVVVPRGERPTLDDLTDYCRARLTSYKLPKDLIFVEALPRNAAGKVLKRELRFP